MCTLKLSINNYGKILIHILLYIYIIYNIILVNAYINNLCIDVDIDNKKKKTLKLQL